MSTRELNVGATVHFTRTMRVEAMPKAEAAVYRVEKLLKLPDGATLYTIKNEAEPFERVVAASDLDARS
jgi:hypothetical protein